MLTRSASLLWRERPHHSEALLKVSMVLGRLTHVGNYTPSLFTDEKAHPVQAEKTNHQVLNESMDKLVQKFGRQSIYIGGAHNPIEAAPMRISFGHIPDLDVEKDWPPHSKKSPLGRSLCWAEVAQAGDWVDLKTNSIVR